MSWQPMMEGAADTAASNASSCCSLCVCMLMWMSTVICRPMARRLMRAW